MPSPQFPFIDATSTERESERWRGLVRAAGRVYIVLKLYSISELSRMFAGLGERAPPH